MNADIHRFGREKKEITKIFEPQMNADIRRFGRGKKKHAYRFNSGEK